MVASIFSFSNNVFKRFHPKRKNASFNKFNINLKRLFFTFGHLSCMVIKCNPSETKITLCDSKDYMLLIGIINYAAFSLFLNSFLRALFHRCYNHLPHNDYYRLMTQRKNAIENVVGKGENASNQHFILFPKCFLYYVTHSFPRMSSVLCYSLSIFT